MIPPPHPLPWNHIIFPSCPDVTENTIPKDFRSRLHITIPSSTLSQNRFLTLLKGQVYLSAPQVSRTLRLLLPFRLFFLLCQFPKRYYMVFENKVFWESHYGAVFSDLHFMNREKYYCLCPGFPVSKQDLLIFLLARVRFCFWLVEEAFVHLKPRNGRCYSPFPFFCT